MMMALARKIVSGDEEDDESETMEEVFAQARNAEADAEEYLVDDGWKAVEVEPEAVEVNGNGHHANGHDDPFGIGPAVELAPVESRNGNGHAATPVNGNGANGHHGDEVEEPQQSLFSWAEFMAEPASPSAATGSPSPQVPLDVRVGDGAGAGEGAGRRGTLGRRNTGGAAAFGAAASPHGNGTGMQHTRKGEERWQGFSCTTAASSRTPMEG